jgi:plastocyanin
MTLRRLCAFSLVVTAAVHFAVVPDHAKEWPLAAVFFVILGVGELALAPVALRMQRRPLLLAGGVASAGSALLWLASRTTGLPFGPGAFAPEALGGSDVVATALEVLAAPAFLRLARVCKPLVAAVAAAVLVTGACSASPSQPAVTRHVAIDTFMFSPRALKLHQGDRVVWTNHDAILHTVTAGTRDYDPVDSGRVATTRKSGVFDLQLDGKGATDAHTFTTRGTQHYFCDRHPGMEADVDVS